MAEQQTQQTADERTRELTDRLEAGMQNLFQSEKYKQYLKTMSQFYSYSTRNTLLIHMQNPGATHVAGFSKELFEKAQELQKRDTRTAPKKNNVYLFSGFLRCDDCRRTVKRKSSGNYIYYECSTYMARTNNLCSKHSIREDKLVKAVLDAIKQQVNLAICYSDILEEINARPVTQSRLNDYQMSIKKKNKELKELVALKEGLYKDWKNNDISKDDYKNMRLSFDEQAVKIKAIINNLEHELIQSRENTKKSNPFLTQFMKYKNITELDREMLVSLVNMIYIAKNGNIHIEFKYNDEYKRLIAYITENSFTA